MSNWPANGGRSVCAFGLALPGQREAILASAMVMSGVPVPTKRAALMMQSVEKVHAVASFNPIVINDHQHGGHLLKRPAAWEDPRD